MDKKRFAVKLLEGDRTKVEQIFETSLKYDRPLLEVLTYALEERFFHLDPLDIVNGALTECGFKGLLIKKEELYISLFNERNGNYLISLNFIKNEPTRIKTEIFLTLSIAMVSCKFDSILRKLHTISPGKYFRFPFPTTNKHLKKVTCRKTVNPYK